MLGLRATAIQRFALVPLGGSPQIYQRETARGSRLRQRRFDAYMFAMRPAVAMRDFVNQVVAGLRELGVAGEPAGTARLNQEAVEALRTSGIHAIDGWRAWNRARAIKTSDELQLIRWTTRAKERRYDPVRHALQKPNVPEERLSRIMLDCLLDQGFEDRKSVV